MPYKALIPPVCPFEMDPRGEISPDWTAYTPTTPAVVTKTYTTLIVEPIMQDFPTATEAYVFDPYPLTGGGGGRPEQGQLWPRGVR